MSEPVTMYMTDWCPFCRSLRNNLDNSQIPYEAINVEAEGSADAAAWVESVNDGNRVVPTILYSDGTHATNPPAEDVEAKYRELTA